MDKLTTRTAKYLERITERMDDSTEDMSRYIQFFIDEMEEKRKDQSASSGFGIINDCNHSGSELTNLLSNAPKMGSRNLSR